MRSPIAFLQPLGRALMLPIAVLPVAALMLRLGQPDLLDIAFLMAAGAAIFDNLGILFAIGVAAGFARDGNGAACLAGIVCYMVSSRGAEALLAVPPAVTGGLPEGAAKTVAAAWRTAAIHRFDVPLGIVAGLTGGLFYNRFAEFRLPDYLAFFGGRRFVPIVSGVAGLAIAALLGLAFAPLDSAVDALSGGVVAAGGWGLFAFGLLNRLLIVTGLHHILNNVAYFVVGDYNGTTGDLRRFFAGDPDAGTFMSGFFPVMMFGLPAACLAMYHEVAADRRKAVGGLLASVGLTSFLTGVTEPIEFSFMFLAPVLYALHAVLTGLAEVLMNALGIRLGYGFSAGLFDYVLNYGKATRPLMLLPVGAAYAVLYYAIFRFAIRRWNLATPGREPQADAGTPTIRAAAGERGGAFVAALGGPANLREIAACTTRLRLVVTDQQRIDEAALRALGAMGVLRPSKTAVQVVVGPAADAIAMEMRAAADTPPAASAPEPVIAPPPERDLPPALAAALGGPANLAGAARHHGRWRVVLRAPATLDNAGLAALGVRASTTLRDDAGRTILHLLIEESAT